MNRALKLLQDPRVAKAVQNPKVINGVMGALKLRADVEKSVGASMKVVAKRLNLATESEVRELRRALHRLERELADERATTRKGRKDRTAE
jgi:hypothetical protein